MAKAGVQDAIGIAEDNSEAAPAAGGGVKRHRYLRPYRLPSLLWSSMSLYRDNWATLAGICLLPVFLVTALGNWLILESPLRNNPIVPFFPLIINSLLLAPVTIAISEACLGVRPRILRSYRRIWGKSLLILLAATLLQYIFIFSGFIISIAVMNAVEQANPEIMTVATLIAIYVAVIILMLAPMILGLTWFMFIPQIVVLERSGIFKCFGRSKSLGKKYYSRNFLYLLAISALYYLVAALGVLALEPVRLSFNAKEWIYISIAALPQIVVTPLVCISLILIYYDLRVRKEGIAHENLEQDLYG